MSLNGHEKRLRALERTITGRGDKCPECGLYGGPPGPHDTYELLIDGPDGEQMPDEDVYCESCGELVIGVISFDDEL